MITDGKGGRGKEWESEVGSIWCGWVARGGLGAVGWLGAAGSRPGTPGCRGHGGRGTEVGRGLGCVQVVGRMCSVLGAMCSVSRRMCSVSGPMCSLLRAMCSVSGGARPPSRPPLAGSEQALQGRRDDGGSGREAGGAHPGMCQLCRANVSRFGADVSRFRANVSSFEGMCPLWRGMCPVLGGAPWLGMGHGPKARFLGSAALRSE